MKLTKRFWSACGLMILLAGCGPKSPPVADNSAPTGDADYRHFSGTIISLRPMISTMKITKEEHVGKDSFPNEIIVKYDEKTHFLMDGAPTTVDKIEQYMTVEVTGHMRVGQMFAERADFSSKLPKNVKKPGEGTSTAP